MLDAYYQDAISLDLLQREQLRLRNQLRELEQQRLPDEGIAETEALARIDMRENAHPRYLDVDLDQKHAMHLTRFGRINLHRREDGSLLPTSTASFQCPTSCPPNCTQVGLMCQGLRG